MYKKTCQLNNYKFILFFATTVSAQTFTDTIFFGDSNTDSGRYYYVPEYTSGPNAGITDNPGKLTTPGGLMWSEALALKYGISVMPNVAPQGGNNYSAAGAHTIYPADSVIGENIWSSKQQIDSYLNLVNGRANPDTLYTLFIASNDLKVPPQQKITPVIIGNTLALSTLANEVIAQAEQLRDAGARYLIVPRLIVVPRTLETAILTGFGPLWSQEWVDSLDFFNKSVWDGLADKNINFIPVDFDSLGNYVMLNPERFGITNINLQTPACNVYSGSCLYDNLADPNAMNTHLFADSYGHLSAVGQKIQADYIYGLLTAPEQISLISAHASHNQNLSNHLYINQINTSSNKPNRASLNYWMIGEGQNISTTGYQTTLSGHPHIATVGLDFQQNQNLVVGSFISKGQSDLNLNTVSNDVNGRISQSETTLGFYLNYLGDIAWINSLISYNCITNNVNRVTPIGIATFSNVSNVNGSNQSVTINIGHRYQYKALKISPIFGLDYIRTQIDSFTESGNFNSLEFGKQKINSSIVSFGFQAESSIGRWLPSLSVIYNNENRSSNRLIMTKLTSVSSPNYFLPAVEYGKNWTDINFGIGYLFETNQVAMLNIRERLSQRGIRNRLLSLSFSNHF